MIPASRLTQRWLTSDLCSGYSDYYRIWRWSLSRGAAGVFEFAMSRYCVNRRSPNHRITHWDLNKLAVILQTTFSNAIFFLNENVVWFKPLKFVPNGLIDYKSALFQKMAWHGTDDKTIKWTNVETNSYCRRYFQLHFLERYFEFRFKSHRNLPLNKVCPWGSNQWR